MARIILMQPGPQRTQRDDCLDYLNIYEIVALGVAEGILDEGFFRRTHEPTLLRDWAAARSLVLSLRDPQTGDPSYFEALEGLVVRWDKSLSISRYRPEDSLPDTGA